MLAKFSKFLRGLTIAALLTMAGAGAVFAQTATGTPGDGPANALMPAAGVVSIAPGQWQWYAFRSQAPFINDDDDEMVWDDAVVDAALRVQSGAVDFEVWSAADLNKWIDGTDFDATGVGTTNESLPGDPLFWEGSFEGNNTYYLIVKSRSTQESFYALNIAGDVTFPTSLVLGGETEPAAQAVTSEEMGLTVEPAAETTSVGVDAATAAMPARGSVEIQPGQWQWYRFTAQTPLAADDDDTTTEHATIDAALRVQSGSASFVVWSAQNFNDWRDGVDFDATGVGTTNESLSGDPLFWQGTFQGNDSFYLVVKNTGTTPAVYTLNITGDVTFPVAALPAQ
ncbi:MAG: hypothetical protein KF832_29340 [Caldilineaceae bacterium]|nr:hypothetical protein [Caldilineaceae bacterium]